MHKRTRKCSQAHNMKSHSEWTISCNINIMVRKEQCHTQEDKTRPRRMNFAIQSGHNSAA